MNFKTKKMVNNTFIFLIGNIGAKFIQFLLVPLYTYTLTTEQYGITELVLTAVNLLMPLFSVSIADGLLRFALDKKYNKKSVLKNSLIIILCGTILSITMIPVFSLHKVLSQWMFYFVLILNLRIYRDIFAIYLKANDKNKLFALDGILYTLILCLCSFVFLVILKFDIKGYFIAYIIANIISIAFLIMVGHPLTDMRKSKIDKGLLKNLLIYSIPMVINGISWWITNASDRYMLEWMMTNSDVGIYSIATKIPTFITTFTGVFNQAWIISAVVEYDEEKEKNFYSETFHKYYFLLFSGAMILLTILKPFMKIYVSESFFVSWKYAAVLICSSIMSGIASFTVGIYAATKENLHVMITTVIGAIINIVLNIFLIPIYGIMGASIATFVSWMSIAFFRLIDIKRIFEFYINYKNILLYSLLVIFQCVAVLFLGKWSYLFSMIVIIMILINEREMFMNCINMIRKKLNINKIKKFIRKLLSYKNNKNNIMRLENKNFTIISSNCIGGIIYHNLKMEFLSPTINMYFESKDFIKFCSNIKHYLYSKLIFIDNSKDGYPIVKCDDIKLYCVHYKDFDEVKEKWERRRERINWKNIFIIMSERDGCTYEDIKQFDLLPFNNKVVFVHKEMPEIKSAYYIPGTEQNDTEGQHIVPLTSYVGKFTGKRYIDYFDYIEFLNSGNIK